jgi:hypothetical protein
MIVGFFYHRSQQEEMQDAEMAWDDSALNITVNPMEVSISQSDEWDRFIKVWHLFAESEWACPRRSR